MKPMTRSFPLWALLLALLLPWQSALARDLPDFASLVEQAAPGVVNISTTRTVERGHSFEGFGGQDIPDIFRHFFGDRFPGGPGGPGGPVPGPGPGQERQSLGSGFIISEDGYILTSAHVVEGADEILVRLADRREMAAELVGADTQTDVAVLKVDAEGLPTLPTGDSDLLRVGEWVAAIGSPFGFDHSVTAGIISAINRTLPRDAYVPFIQTDVAINPGNSGGPLFNLDGEVVGINAQIFTRSGGFMGLSFAVPINVAMDVASQLRDDGRVRRGWLGVMIQPVSRDLAESFGMDSASGALIADLDPEGPAAEGGVRAGDIILEVDGEEVERSRNLPRLIGRVSPGSDAELTIMRDGQREQVTVTIGDWPESDEPRDTRDERSAQARLGIAVSELDDAERERLGIEAGVMVRDVEPEGAAALAGIRRGDVIVSIDHHAVESGSQLLELVEELPTDRAIPVRLYRDGRSLFVALRLGQS
ncbi:DegQ family serine endoprotease [Halomonas sp. M5N1S17]|uniref:DegQ family serine endoprotease n=1 Tax=Halomonas alkalisoli TaxID=2907158 RepID=UPI001F19FE13|nr:DegQ family serine endoprotease [Halomonas alkalisoli]MCE9663420.1 DegQ family serine endoprotease [Halomonas alkalisoli]